jgi:hypothetical protein
VIGPPGARQALRTSAWQGPVPELIAFATNSLGTPDFIENCAVVNAGTVLLQ